jgi:hypothetical protein
MLKALCCIFSCFHLCATRKKKIMPVRYDHSKESHDKQNSDKSDIDEILVDIMYHKVKLVEIEKSKVYNE